MSTDSDIGGELERLFSLKAHGSRFGIDRMRALAAELGHPERLTPCIHVAGTNGKGSVSAMVDAILHAAGWRTGLFTSPHLVDVGERVQVERRPLTRADMLAHVRAVQPAAARIAAMDPDLAPSFFEYMTAIAFREFARTRCDIAVYEVGLGGRLDATNVVVPEVSVITSIGLDHCELLGTSVAQIAAEKAGIIKPGVPVVIGRMPPDAEAVIRAKAAEVAAPLRAVTQEFGEVVSRLPETSLAGEYQRWNAATATLAARTLPAKWKIAAGHIAEGLQRVSWAGRWQRLAVAGKTLILDASHNPEGARALDGNLAQLVRETGRCPTVITGVLGSERAGPLLEVICRHAAEVHLVVPDQPRACTREELARLIPRDFRGGVIFNSVEAVFPGPGECTVGADAETVVVTGSIYLAGEVMGRLGLSADGW